jgi:hypothetical protein
MNRRTALMQAVEVTSQPQTAGFVTEVADYFYAWLQTSPVSERPPAAPVVPSTGDSSFSGGAAVRKAAASGSATARPGLEEPPEDSPVGTGADNEGGSGGSESAGDREASTGSNPGPSSPDHSNDHVHLWVDSPKLSKYEICSVENCMETRRKDSRA